MSCDIHFHTEIKVNGKWEHYSKPEIRRNYPLFGYLAGVRNALEVVPITEPRGLPDDCSVVTKIACNNLGLDGHSHSFLFKEEMCLVENFLKNQVLEGWHGKLYYFPEDILGYLFGNSWSDFMEYREDYPTEIEDIRWVFWFDS